MDLVVKKCADLGVQAVVSDHWGQGGAGAEDMARAVVAQIEKDESNFQPLYSDEMSLWNKIRTIASSIYGAEDIIADMKIRQQIEALQEDYGRFPICIAKTQYSFSTDPNLKGAPSGHIVPIREVRLAAGAEFLVVICGDIMILPGLPRVPAAEKIHINSEGRIVGLF